MAKSIDKLKFQDLMQYRVHEILLVASPYDAFILEQDGRLSEQILTEFKGMNLSYAPRIWNAHTAQEALNMIQERPYDLVIVMLRISDMNPLSFAKKIKKKYPRKPMVLLAFDESEVKQLPEDFVRLAHTQNTPDAAIALHKRNFYGVQFHPESIVTEYGLKMVENFLGCK